MQRREQATPRLTPSRDLGIDESVAWQNNTVHDGYNPGSPLVPPLGMKWSRDLGEVGVTSVSYPLIAQGLVFITTATTGNTNAIMALDENSGATIWSAEVTSTFGAAFVNAAYDSGRVFVVNADGLMKAFDAPTGTLLWSVLLTGQFFFTSPPTAANGIVFTGGAESGGTVYAVDETNGQILWTMSVENGDHSSPAVTGGNVYVSYACPQSYAFNATTGEQLWHYSSCCEGGGGVTPVVHDGLVYVRDDFCDQTSGLVLDANTGIVIGGFNADRPPAFIGNLAVYYQSGNVVGVDIPSGQQLWSFAGDGGLTSAPVIVNQTIYVGSNSGTLFGLNTSGQQIWNTQVGAPIPAPDEFNFTLTTGLGSGDGLLIVPTDSLLVAYTQGTPTPTPTASPTPTSTQTPTCTPAAITLQGSITDDDPTKNSVIGAVSSCAVSPACPGELPGPYHYDAYQLTNSSGNPSCMTLVLSDPTCIYSEVYLGSFDPNNACTNYLADNDQDGSYSITVPGSATIWVVVEEFAPGGCANYTVTVSGLGVCSSPTPTASPTATATVTPTATPTPTPTATARPTPTPRQAPTPRPRPTMPAPRP